MPDDENTLHDLLDADEQALARELADLGPLMQRQEQAEASAPNADFARTLRARLLAAERDETQPDPAFARELRERLTTLRGPQPRRRTGRRSRIVVPAALVALVAAVLLGIVLVPRLFPKPHTPIHQVATPQVPRPATGDLTRGFPPWQGGGGGGGGVVSPTRSTLSSVGGGGPYTGHLSLASHAFAQGPRTLPVYRLRGPRFDVPRIGALARLLGIQAHPKEVASDDAVWLVAVDAPHAMTMHSIAVSTATGELAYHDTAFNNLPPGKRPPDKATAIAAARAWLARLGWPGRAMPLASATPFGFSWLVTLGWPGVGPANMAAATVAVSYGGHIVEADLWPPALRIGTVDTQGVASAWDAVRHGRAPIAVAPRQLSVRPGGSGQGRVHNWSITYILTARADGTLYLIPAYRFDGSGRFDAYPNTAPPTDKVPASWYALVPAEST